MFKKILKILKIFIILAPFVLFFWILEREFIPFGKFQVSQDFIHKTRLVSLLKNASPIETESGSSFQKLLVQKTSFKTKVPRRFKQAQIILEYQNPTKTTLNLGLVEEEKKKNSNIKPVEFKPIDQLSWNKLEKDNITLYQKQKRFISLDDFFKNIPDDQKIAQYFYDLEKELIIPNYKKSDQVLEINQTWRGSLIIYTYIKNEDLDFTFKKQDLNWYGGPDPMDISIAKGDDIIFRDSIPDDGNTQGGLLLGPIQEKHIQIPNLEEGIYKIDLSTSSRRDVLIQKIITKQHLLVFSGPIYFAGNKAQYQVSDQDVNLYTDAPELTIQTPHDTALQDFSCNDQFISLQETHKIYNLKYELSLDQLNQLYFPIADFEIQVKGVFALDKENFFNPKPKNILDFREDTNLDNIDYVITTYASPKETNGWKRQEVKLSTEQALLENKEYTFTISAPNFDPLNDEIKIKKIDILFKKESIELKDLIPKFINYIKRPQASI